jgi:hypothetical protein
MNTEPLLRRHGIYKPARRRMVGVCCSAQVGNSIDRREHCGVVSGEQTNAMSCIIKYLAVHDNLSLETMKSS